MARYDYKVIPAPTKGAKAKGVKTPEARFALAIEECMNTLGAEGWDYLRADILPSEERQGLTSTRTIYRSVLVFRRPVRGEAADTLPVVEEDLIFADDPEETPPEAPQDILPDEGTADVEADRPEDEAARGEDAEADRDAAAKPAAP